MVDAAWESGGRRVLIAGCGYVGAALAASLVADGADVFGVARSAAPHDSCWHAVTCDLRRPIPADVLPPDLDAVVYLAAPDGDAVRADLEGAYRSVFIDGPRHLLDALASQRHAPRFLFASSTSVYGIDDGSWFDETSPTEPQGRRGELLLEGEATSFQGNRDASAVRFGGIYGPGRNRLIAALREGRIPKPTGAEAERYTNRIHRDDAAGMLRHLLSLPALEPVYLGVDDEPAPRGDVLEFLAQELGVRLPEPEPGAQTASPPRRRVGSKRGSNRRIRETGFVFAYPSYREGYAAILAKSRE